LVTIANRYCIDNLYVIASSSSSSSLLASFLALLTRAKRKGFFIVTSLIDNISKRCQRRADQWQ